MKLLSKSASIPTDILPDPPEGAIVDIDAKEIHAHVFTLGGIFVTADAWGNVVLWTPRYEIGQPTRAQRLAGAALRNVPVEAVTDLDLFLIGGATPTTVLRDTNPTLN